VNVVTKKILAAAARKPVWRFCLYVADHTPRSIRAFENLVAFCEKEFPGKYTIQVVDVIANPKSARAENIVALPTLVQINPAPMKRLIGDLSRTSGLTSEPKVRLSA
jgi:circadian clock protein KaiB